MKILTFLYFFLILIATTFADIPLDKNGNNKTMFSDFNYLPLAYGILFAVGILAFIATLKKEKDAQK